VITIASSHIIIIFELYEIEIGEGDFHAKPPHAARFFGL
jgi:hypothetical protein